MSGVQFTVPGKPVTWKRTTSYQGRRLTPKVQREYQAHVAFCASVVKPSTWPMDRRYRLVLEVHQSDKRRSDLDNYAKQAGDALNGVLWEDDSQIDAIEVERFFTEKPHMNVRVEVVA